MHLLPYFASIRHTSMPDLHLRGDCIFQKDNAIVPIFTFLDQL
jgi:hypothetical protein